MSTGIDAGERWRHGPFRRMGCLCSVRPVGSVRSVRSVWSIWSIWIVSTLVLGLVWPVSPGRADEEREGTSSDPEASNPEALVDSLLADPLIPPSALIDALEELLRQSEAPEEAWAHRAADTLGRIYLGAGREELAIPYLEFAVRGRMDDADLLNTLGYTYAEQGIKLERAEELVRQALELTDGETRAQTVGFYRDSLGWTLFRQGEIDSALAHLEAAVELAPGTPEIRAHLIEVYTKLERIDDASALLVEDLVVARGVDAELRMQLRRLHRTTPVGRPLPVEQEVDRRVRALEVAEIEAVEALGGRVIQLTATDGQPLVASLFTAHRQHAAPAVVLVHMLGSDRTAYRNLAARLVRAGVHALTLDVRGHGASVTQELPHMRAFGEDFAASFGGAVQDVAAALDYLREAHWVDSQRIGVIGAGFGGLWAAMASQLETELQAIVVLSPLPQDAFEVALRADGARSTLFVSGTDDPVAMATAEQLRAALAPQPTQFVTYDDAGRGTDMLTRVPELESFLVEWLQKALARTRRL